MRSHRQSPWTNTFFSFAVPIVIGALCIGGCCMFFSALTFFVLETMQFTGIFNAAALAAGGVVSGYVCGKYRRRYGLLDGIICGGVLAAVLVICGLTFSGAIPMLWKPILMTVSGAVGGVTGVNSKRPEKLM